MRSDQPDTPTPGPGALLPRLVNALGAWRHGECSGDELIALYDQFAAEHNITRVAGVERDEVIAASTKALSLNDQLRAALYLWAAEVPTTDEEATAWLQAHSVTEVADPGLFAAIREAVRAAGDTGFMLAGTTARTQAARLCAELARANTRCEQLTRDLDRMANDYEAIWPDGKIAVTLTVDHEASDDSSWAGHVTVYGFAAHSTAVEVGQVLADALARHVGAPVRPDLIPTTLTNRIGTGPADTPADAQRRLDHAVPHPQGVRIVAASPNLAHLVGESVIANATTPVQSVRLGPDTGYVRLDGGPLPRRTPATAVDADAVDGPQ